MSISQTEIEGIVCKTISVFNRLKSPEALTKSVHISPDIITIEFSGSLCYECGDVEKYVLDFQKDFRVFIDYLELEAGKATQIGTHSFQVNFLVKRKR